MGIGLSGKSVIVTGAATGVGLAVAQRFAEAGAKVTMVDADEDLLESEAAAINETEPEGEAQTFHGSVEEKLCMTNLIATAIGSYDSIDVLVNANRMLYSAKPLESEAEKFEAILSENVIANFRLSRMVALRMMEIEEASDRDNYMSAEEAAKYGLVDKVLESPLPTGGDDKDKDKKKD